MEARSTKTNRNFLVNHWEIPENCNGCGKLGSGNTTEPAPYLFKNKCKYTGRPEIPKGIRVLSFRPGSEKAETINPNSTVTIANAKRKRFYAM